MTISTSASKVVCLGNGMTTQFAFNFLIPLSGQEVIIYTDALGNQTTLPNSLYTVIGFGQPAGGTVIYPLIGSPIATGTTLTIARVLPLVQTTSISNQGAFYPNVVESALDYLTMEVQQVQQGSNQAIKIPVVDNIVLNALPPAAQRANMLLSFDNSGQPVAVQPAAPVNLQSWAVVTRAAGFDTWVATPSSANLLALMQDKTGTGKLVFANSPTLSAPILAGATSGTTLLNATAIASGVLTLPAATDTLIGKATTDTLTNKTYDTAGTGNSFLINGLAATANTGTGSVVRATSPTLVTPTLGAATATSLTAPLLIGGSGTTGTQLTLKSTTGAGTTDTIALVGGNNGATTFGTFGTTNLNLPQTTASTSKTTGALVVGGGIGAGGAVWAGGALNPGPGSFVASTPQIYTDSTLGIVVTAGTGSSTDFGFYSAAGTALLSNPTGTANLALCQTANGTAAVATTPIAGAHLTIGAGTTAKAPLEFTSGTNKTTVAAGDWEFDGNAFYASCAASSRQVVAAKQISTVQSTTNALSNSSTSAQSIFQSGRSTLTLAASTSYRFRARLGFNTGATSHTTAFGFGGTATFTTINYTATATSTTIGTPAAAQVTPVNVATATVLTAASTAARTEIRLEGIVRINAAGTVIPQVTFSAGPTGTCETALDSFIEFEPIGSNTATSVGNWA